MPSLFMCYLSEAPMALREALSSGCVAMWAFNFRLLTLAMRSISLCRFSAIDSLRISSLLESIDHVLD